MDKIVNFVKPFLKEKIRDRVMTSPLKLAVPDNGKFDICMWKICEQQQVEKKLHMTQQKLYCKDNNRIDSYDLWSFEKIITSRFVMHIITRNWYFIHIFIIIKI